jgi:hypothetical protein
MPNTNATTKRKTPTRKTPTRAKRAATNKRASASSGGASTIKSAFKPMALATLRMHAKALGYRVIQATPA